MDKKKRQRCCNMTSSEKVLLADLVVKYSEVLENKRTDSVPSSSRRYSLQNTLAHFALCRLTVLFYLKMFPYAFLFDLHIVGLSQFLHTLVATENLLSIHTFTVPVTGHWAVTDQ